MYTIMWMTKFFSGIYFPNLCVCVLVCVCGRDQMLNQGWTDVVSHLLKMVSLVWTVSMPGFDFHVKRLMSRNRSSDIVALPLSCPDFLSPVLYSQCGHEVVFFLNLGTLEFTGSLCKYNIPKYTVCSPFPPFWTLRLRSFSAILGLAVAFLFHHFRHCGCGRLPLFWRLRSFSTVSMSPLRSFSTTLEVAVAVISSCPVAVQGVSEFQLHTAKPLWIYLPLYSCQCKHVHLPAFVLLSLYTCTCLCTLIYVNLHEDYLFIYVVTVCAVGLYALMYFIVCMTFKVITFICLWGLLDMFGAEWLTGHLVDDSH